MSLGWASSILPPPTLGALGTPGSLKYQVTELLPKLYRRTRTLRRLFFQAAKHDLLETRWNRSTSPLRGTLGSSPGVGNQHRRRLASEDRLPCQHPVGDAAE